MAINQLRHDYYRRYKIINMVVPLISKIVKPKGHQVANFEKTVAQVSYKPIFRSELFLFMFTN